MPTADHLLEINDQLKDIRVKIDNHIDHEFAEVKHEIQILGRGQSGIIATLGSLTEKVDDLTDWNWKNAVAILGLVITTVTFASSMFF